MKNKPVRNPMTIINRTPSPNPASFKAYGIATEMRTLRHTDEADIVNISNNGHSTNWHFVFISNK